MSTRTMRWLLLIFILGSGWRLYFYYDHALWQWLVQGTDLKPDTAWLVFVIGMYAVTYLGLLLVRPPTARWLGVCSMAAALVLSLAAWALPALRSSPVTFAALGMATGLFNAVIIFEGSTRVPPEARLPAIGIVVLGFFVLVYALTFAAGSLGFATSLALSAVVLAACLFMTAFLPRSERPAVAPATVLPFPGRLVAMCGLTVFVAYFGSYLNQGAMSTQTLSFGDVRLAALGLLVRAAVCGVFIAAGRRIRIVSVLYVALASVVLAFATSLLRERGSILAWVMYNVSNASGTVALYGLVAAVAYKYLRRPQTFALLLLLTGAGIVFGSLAGRAVHQAVGDEPMLDQVIPLIIYCAVFFAFPFVIRTINREVDLDRADSPGFFPRGGPVAAGAAAPQERDVIAFRDRIVDSLVGLNATFDKEYRLTTREREIASYLVERYDYETIAETLFISVNTLKAHAKSIYRKYDIPNRKALIELIETQLQRRAAG